MANEHSVKQRAGERSVGVAAGRQKGDELTPEQEGVVRGIWLNYYNNVLFEKGIITEREYRRMQAQIATRYPYKRR